MKSVHFKGDMVVTLTTHSNVFLWGNYMLSGVYFKILQKKRVGGLGAAAGNAGGTTRHHGARPHGAGGSEESARRRTGPRGRRVHPDRCGGGAPRGGTLRDEVETGQEPPRWRWESCPVTRSERPGGSSLEHPGGLGLERSEVTVIPTAEAPQPRREPGPA